MFAYYPYSSMSNYILFGIYLFLILGIFGFLTIFMMHIRDYLQYSRYLKGITRFYLVLMVVIAIFGGYSILTGDIFPQSKSAVKRINL